MSILSFGITRNEWLEMIYRKSKSNHSQNNAITGIKRWDKFLQHIDTKEYDILLELKNANDSTDVYTFLNRYVQWLGCQNISAQTTRVFFTILKSWLRANGIRINSDDVKQFIQFPRSIKVPRKPLTKENIQLLFSNSPKKLRVILLVLLSSGMRISELLQIRVKDVPLFFHPVMEVLQKQSGVMAFHIEIIYAGKLTKKYISKDKVLLGDNPYTASPR